MRFYTDLRRFYCTVNLHARTMSVCILDQTGQVLFEKTCAAEAVQFPKQIAPFRHDLVVCCECLFCWYLLAEVCVREQIAFILGRQQAPALGLF